VDVKLCARRINRELEKFAEQVLKIMEDNDSLSELDIKRLEKQLDKITNILDEINVFSLLNAMALVNALTHFNIRLFYEIGILKKEIAEEYLEQLKDVEAIYSDLMELIKRDMEMIKEAKEDIKKIVKNLK